MTNDQREQWRDESTDPEGLEWASLRFQALVREFKTEHPECFKEAA